MTSDPAQELKKAAQHTGEALDDWTGAPASVKRAVDQLASAVDSFADAEGQDDVGQDDVEQAADEDA